MLNLTEEEFLEFLNVRGAFNPLISFALNNEEIARRICWLAGFLAQYDQRYREVLENQIRLIPGARLMT